MYGKHLPLVARMCGAPRARAARLHIVGRAQLVGLRQDQDRAAQPSRPRRRRQARFLPHEALQLKEKLQRAGYKQENVKWDTDSDTDDSDDEDDLKV